MDMQPARLTPWTAAMVAVLCAPAQAEDLYVAPDGSDSNPGTLDAPFASVDRAQSAAAPGDTVYLRGGVYRFSGTQAAVGVSLTKSGQSGKPIRYFAQPGEIPIFDLFELTPQARVTGIDLQADWLHLRGIEVRGVRQLVVGDSWGVRIRGDHNVVEQLHVHSCEAPGIFITSGASNLVLNCDSHHNYDPLEDGGNADGFGCHSAGGDNVLRGCRAYENSDDGFDFINAAGTCIAESSWAFRNGYIPDTNMVGANGAGFKSGGFGLPPNTPDSGAPRHVIRSSLAFGNRAIGFYANYHPGGLDFLNNTAFDNPANYDMRPATGMSTDHTLRNNVAAAPGQELTNWSGGSDEFNSWNLPVEVSPDDFTSMDKALALAPRQADGSLPDVPLMRLATGSDLIDRGQDVDLPFTGAAPDLGAFEWGAPTAADPMDAGAPDVAPVPDVDAGVATPPAAGGQAVPPTTAPTQPPTEPTKPVTTAPSAGTGGSAAPAAAGAGAHAPAGDAGAAASPESGCGCRVQPARPSARAPLALLAVLFGLGVRTRARRQRRSPRR
jgi:MYXO-CTERM domain-containing protein